jgi:tetracenomycin A2 monooxygenase-dioxygenase
MYDVKIPVLIVGGGPVGLSTALFSGRRGVSTMLLEKRDSTSMLPRAPGLQARTMELFRAAGLGKDIRALEKGNSHAYFEGGIIKVDTFSDIDNAELLESPSLDGPTVSPERVMGCGQDRYEKVLVAKAREYGADVRFNTKLLSFETDEEGVTAIAEEAATGRRLTIRADYLVGADGAGSRIRRALGVERVGRGTVFNALSIYFRAPELESLLKDRKFILCYASAGGSLMGLSRLHGCDPWLAAPIYYPEKGEKPEDYTDERCVEIVRRAAGKDIDVEIMDKVPWQAPNWCPRPSAWAGSSSPATPRMCTRRPVVSAPTPVSTTRTTCPGSWPPCTTAGAPTHCWTPMTPSAARWAPPCRSRRWCATGSGTATRPSRTAGTSSTT